VLVPANEFLQADVSLTTYYNTLVRDLTCFISELNLSIAYLQALDLQFGCYAWPSIDTHLLFEPVSVILKNLPPQIYLKRLRIHIDHLDVNQISYDPKDFYLESLRDILLISPFNKLEKITFILDVRNMERGTLETIPKMSGSLRGWRLRWARLSNDKGWSVIFKLIVSRWWR
jgi:hypothetical protein